MMRLPTACCVHASAIQVVRLITPAMAGPVCALCVMTDKDNYQPPASIYNRRNQTLYHAQQVECRIEKRSEVRPLVFP